MILELTNLTHRLLKGDSKNFLLKNLIYQGFWVAVSYWMNEQVFSSLLIYEVISVIPIH